jgi:AcrR family transcriptional regulator
MPPSDPAPRGDPPPVPAPGRRGRPRSAVHDDAILEAAARLLGELGYSRMSMEAVAAAAGVSKPTLYLRYGSKAELVAAAFERLRMGGAPAPSGDLRADLVAQLRHLRLVFAHVGMSMVGVCLAEQEHLPDLIAALRDRSLHPGRQLMRDALAAARGRGEIGPDADIETAIETSIGAYYARYLAGEGFDAGWEERVADATLRALGAGTG